MQNLKTILINLLMIFVISVHSSSNISLCHDVPSTWSNFTSMPEVVLIREHHLDDNRMISAMEDAVCWIKKHFNVNSSYTIKTKGDDEGLCYSISTINMKVKQLMIVISEGQSAQNCTPSIYGPIPNILNVKMFVDGTKNSSVRRMELSFRNPGGHLGVQFEFHRRSVVSKIQKTVQFMLQLNSQTSHYSELTPFWKPTVFLPPSSWQYRKREEEEKKKQVDKRSMSISWVLVISTLPMLFFGVFVSCYIVIQPRGGLTYTDEEVDFTIQEVDSASRVNMVQPKTLDFKTAPISYINPTTLSSTSSEETNTAIEPARREEPAPKTAIPLDNEEVHTDPTVKSELKSTKTVRLPVTQTNDDGGVSAETFSLRTGRD